MHVVGYGAQTTVVNPKEVINVLTQQLSDNEVTFYYKLLVSLPDKSSIILQENQILEYEYLFNCSNFARTLPNIWAMNIKFFHLKGFIGN